MAHTYTLKKKGLFATPFIPQDIQKIAQPEFQFSSFDGSYRITETLDFQHEVAVWTPETIGRGFGVQFKGKEIFVRMNYLVTENDINDTFRFINLIMDNFKVNVTGEDGQSFPTKQTLEKENQRQNDFNLRYVAGEDKVFTIFAVKNPITLNFSDFSNDPKQRMKEYTEYLDAKQNFDYYTMAPRFYEDKDQNLHAVYVMTTGVLSIIPIEPYIMMARPEFEEAIKDASIGFFDYDTEERVGQLPYSEFAKSLSSLEKYDEYNLIHPGITRAEIDILLDAYSE